MTTVDHALAVVYMRTDLSGHARRLDECRIRRLAIRFGYDVCDVLLVDGCQSQRLVHLEDRIRAHRAEAVFVPTVEHLDGQSGRIVAQADVIEQSGETYARWSPIALTLSDSALERSVARATGFRLSVGSASNGHSTPTAGGGSPLAVRADGSNLGAAT